MIIHEVERDVRGDRIRLSVKIETERPCNIPDTLWFEFPIVHQHDVTLSHNGFLASVLPILMALKEDIHVRGSISPRLHSGLREYQRILNFWFPSKLQPVSISADRYEEYVGAPQRTSMTTFSGGVDSSYTLWSHLPAREPIEEQQITHAILVQGFDIPLTDTESFTSIRTAYDSILRAHGVSLIPVRTNVKEFSMRRGFEWVLTHSAAVVGTALFFEPIISSFHFPLNDTLDNALPSDGLHPTLVPTLSTAALAVLPSGGTATKLDKVRALASWPPQYQTLRVCFEHIDGVKNCGECWKCVYTMTYLDMAGTLSKYNTFLTPLTRRKIRHTRFYPDLYYYYPWIRRHAASVKRYDIIVDHTVALLRSYLKNFRAKRVKCYYYPDEEDATEALFY